MLSYILFDKMLLRKLRTETSPAFQNGQLDHRYLMENCPQLDATFQETLRLTSGALSARKITSPTPLRDKVLQSGNTILIPFTQLHLNRAAFDNPKKFDSERFLKNKSLSYCSSFKPFGGGVSYCPGRYVARLELLVFVALLINRFELELPLFPKSERPQTFPALDVTTPSLGINGPVKGADVYLTLGRIDYIGISSNIHTISRV